MSGSCLVTTWLLFCNTESPYCCTIIYSVHSQCTKNSIVCMVCYTSTLKICCYGSVIMKNTEMDPISKQCCKVITVHPQLFLFILVYQNLIIHPCLSKRLSITQACNFSWILLGGGHLVMWSVFQPPVCYLFFFTLTVFMLVLILEVQEGCNSVVDTCI